MLVRQKQADLVEYLQYFPVLGIVGPRQVGKTTLSKKLIQNELNKEVIYLDLENPEDKAKLNDPVLFFKVHQDKCIILDEVQRKPELFPVLRSMIDLNRVPARFIVLGSASPDLIRDSSESLAGRIVYEELTPFSLTEVIHLKDVFYHWFVGGFPEAFLIKKNKIRNVWFSNFIKTYVERDLPMLGLNIDRTTIRKLWGMAAHLQGSILNVSSLSKSLSITSPTVKRYLSFLEDAFLIRLLPAYAVNLKKRLVKSPKIYLRDTGLLHHLLRINTLEELQGHPILGNSWEGYVIEQIIQQGGDHFEYHYYRTHEGAECDLVLIKAEQPVACVEIKYTSSPKTSKGMLQSFSDLNAHSNFIVTPQTDDYALTEQINVCSLESFLTKHLKHLKK